MSTINLSLIDASLVSGSCEKLREVTQNAFTFEESTYGGVYSHGGGASLDSDSYLSDIKSNYNLSVVTSDTALLKSYTFPVRLYGNNSKITDDQEWFKIINGGSYSEKTFIALYEQDSYYSDNNFSLSLPYGNLTSKRLNEIDSVSYDSIKITPVYNYSLESFENASTFLNEKQLPSIYFFQTINDIEQDGLTSEGFNAVVEDSILFGGSINDYLNTTISTVSELLAPTEMSELNGTLPPEESLYYGNYDSDSSITSDTFFDRNFNLRNYLSSAFVSLSPYQTNTLIANSVSLQSLSDNIIFDPAAALDYIDESSDVLSNAELFPSYVKVEIPKYEEEQVIKNLISDNAVDVYFLLEALSNIFNTNTLSAVSAINYSIERNYNSVTNSSVDYVEDTLERRSNYCDLLEVLTNHLNGTEYLTGQTIFFAGEQNPFKQLASSQLAEISSIARSTSITRMLQVLVDYMNDNSQYDLSSYDAEQTYQEILNFSSKNVYEETLAYKIVKKDSSGRFISNFWIYNNEDASSINLVDSQVILNTRYTYEVYQYKIVNGYNYSYTDYRISTTISSETDSDGNLTGVHVLEFRDTSGNPAEQLFELEEDNAYLSANPFATNAQVQINTDSGDSQYMLDFFVNFSPSLKIVEIPVFSKTLIIRDHPSTTVDVIPYQVLNDSQKIGFTLLKEAYHKRNLPIGLNQVSRNFIAQYKSSNDLLDSEKVSIKSRKTTAAVNVYRLTRKPNSYLDFANNLYKSINMITEDTGTPLSRVVCESTVETNVKYYYAFQFINLGGMVGAISEIYEVELVDDGGYKYAIFNVLNESDLDDNTINKSSIDFKKLIQLVPNTQQMTLITDNADFSENSYTQLDNVDIGLADLTDAIWGKTFKLRLTSKKTGKKIDLNITYNLENG